MHFIHTHIYTLSPYICVHLFRPRAKTPSNRCPDLRKHPHPGLRGQGYALDLTARIRSASTE